MSTTRAQLEDGLRLIHSDPLLFSQAVMQGKALRRYQTPAAQAIAESVILKQGREFAVVFSRQSGKDEMLAQLCTFLLSRYRLAGGSVVVGLPALRPKA